MKAMAATLVLVFISIGLVTCQPGMNICSKTCPTSQPYVSVNTTTDATYRYITTSTCPPYKNPNWTNPDQACLNEKTYKFPLHPKTAHMPIPITEKLTRINGTLYLKDSDPHPIMGGTGLLLSGVLVYGAGAPCYSNKTLCKDQGGPSNILDAVESEGSTFDSCGGHSSPDGYYHVHSGNGFANNPQRLLCDLPEDEAGSHSKLLGWMFDGFGLYGINSLGGVPPNDLDACQGHKHILNGTEIYHYHLPNNTYPWTIGCYTGCPEVSDNPSELTVVNNNPVYGCAAVPRGQPNVAARVGIQVALCMLLASLVTCLI